MELRKWGPEELRFVLESASTNSLSRAASNLGVASSTLTNRIAQLEEKLGFRLFDRTPRGAFLTPQGLKLLPEMQKAVAALEDLEIRSNVPDLAEAQNVRLSTTDGIATFWLSAQLGRLQGSHPDIVLQCDIADHPADPLLAHTDLSIRHRPPESEEFVARPLGALHYFPYASRAYIERFGMPSRKTLDTHRLVEHSSYQFMTGPWYRWQSPHRLSGTVALRTNIGAMTVTAIRNGAGIGLLPTYVSLIHDDLVPLDLDVHMQSELWLCYLRRTGSQPAKRAVASWLQQAFDGADHACFRSDFVHPERFGQSS